MYITGEQFKEVYRGKGCRKREKDKKEKYGRGRQILSWEDRKGNGRVKLD